MKIFKFRDRASFFVKNFNNFCELIIGYDIFIQKNVSIILDFFCQIDQNLWSISL